jgi:hypothetical protein
LIIAFLVFSLTDFCPQEDDVAVELRRPSPIDVTPQPNPWLKPVAQSRGM